MKIDTIWSEEKKHHGFFRKLVSLILVIILISSNLPLHTPAEEQPLTLTKSVDKANPLTGEEFVYTIKYSNPSTVNNAYDVVIEDVLPANVKYVSNVISSDVESVSVTNDGSHDVVRFIFKNVLTAGHTGLVKIVAKFPEGKTPALVDENPNVAINTATIKPSNGELVTSNPVTVTPKLITPDWSVTKTRYIPATVLPVVDQNVTYEIAVNSNRVIGGMDLKDIVVTDTIPVGAEYVSATNGGTFEDGKVTWNIPTLEVGKQKKFCVVIKYPSPTFTTSSSVTNSVLATAKQYDDSDAPDKTASAIHGFVAPIYDAGTFVKNGRQSNDRYSVGQTAKFTLDSIKNSGNVSFDKIEIIDHIPSEINLTSISTGEYSSDVNVNIQYKSNLKTAWTDWSGSPYSSPSNSNLNVSSLGLEEGEYVTQVIWTITDTTGNLIQPGFTNTAGIKVNGIVSMPTSGNKITNTATLQAYSEDVPVVTKNVAKDIYVINAMPWLIADKTVKNNQVHFNYNDTVEFNLRIKNNDFATGNYVNPILVDTIPEEFTDITYTGWDPGNSGIITDPVVNTSGTKNIGGKDYSCLTANITGSLAPGEYIDIKYTAKIKDKTEAGYITNSLYLSTLDNDTIYENDASELITDHNDLDDDGSSADRFVKDDAKIFVNFMGSLQSQLIIKGQNDTDFGLHEYPDYAETLPGGIVAYRLTIKNSGSNGPISNLVLIDKLPTINDTGVVDSSPRDTKWNPYLVNLVTGKGGIDLPEGTTIYYSTIENPSCVELVDPLDKTGDTSDQWSLTPPDDITTVKSIKIDFGSRVFKTNDEVTIEWPMRAPVGAPSNLIAWNSFGYGATYPDSDGTGENEVLSAFLPSEPLKVGFKIKEPVSVNVGDFVWEDRNKNGIQDVGEKGINGVRVNLYQKDGSDYTLVDYTRTGYNQDGDSGYYTFPDTLSGTYRIEFVYPKSYTDNNGYTSNYYLAPFKSGADEALDSNGDPATFSQAIDMDIEKNSVKTPDFTLDTNEDMSIDLGLYRLGQIGDLVWNDKNADGIQNSGEDGIAGVTVTLLDESGNPAKYGNDSVVQPVTTNSSGEYLFTGLEPGRYKVKFDILDGYKLSSANAGSDDEIDSDPIDVVGTNATTDSITLQSGEINKSIDMGLYLGHIGNLVFHDLNADGIKNGSDTAISGVTVKLYKDGGTNAIMTTTTDGLGVYSFDELFPGDYVVEVIKPAAYNKFSPATVSTPATDNDSDILQATGKTDTFTISAGERIDTIDAGMYKFGSIGDLVWNDKNANGIQDSGESGISGINVKLTDKNDNPVTNGLGDIVSDVTTDINGKYTFSNLEVGEYKIVFTNPDQKYKWSPSKQGSNNAVDSDGVWSVANDATTIVSGINLTSGSNTLTVDQGMYLIEIGDFVWNDLNANGKQDVGEPGISGVQVSLLDENLNQAKDLNGVLVSAVTTNASGYYKFENLVAGNYVVQFSMPTGYDKVTSSFVGTVDKDSDADTTTLRSGVISLTTAQRNLTIDAGFYKYAKIGDYVWNDLNANGIQDAGETGISGATVNLLNGSGVQIDSTTTSATGLYSFDELIPGDYSISVIKPSGYDGASNKLQGSDRAKDSNVDPSTLKSDTVTLISGQNNTSVDAAFYKYASIGDYVWEDTNGNGIQDNGENPIAGVTVNLQNSSGAQIVTTVTDINGFYSFTSLVPGSYFVEIALPASYGGITLKTQASDVSKDSNINRATLKSDSITIISGENNMTVDAGLYKSASIGNFVWNDKNADGIQDSGENGISNLTVKLYDNLGANVKNTTTDADGAYAFTNLIPGSYTVEVVKTTGYVNSPKYQGTTANDSNLNPATSKSDSVTVLSGESNQTIDAGLYKMATIGDFVWDDLNADGIQDAGESGIAGVTVKLLNGSGTQLATYITDASGHYSFSNRIPGTYMIEVVKPTGFNYLSMKAQGYDPTKDSNLNADFKSDLVTLISGETNNSIDAGFYKSASIGDYVWSDSNADGIQNSGEIGIANVTVKLLNNFGDEITTATTNSSGFYSFTNLVPATYSIEVVKPDGYDNLSSKIQGSDRTKDSNINSNLISDAVTLVSGENNMTIDAGFYKLAALGDYVWEDSNGNGIQDTGEKPIPGVTVNLLNGSGTQLKTTVTDASGLYSFTSLVPDTYIIEIANITPYNDVTLKTQGSNTDKDSNINAVNLKSDPVTIISGENNQSVDAGLYKSASIGDFVWDDKNANGTQSIGESGMDGVTVNLFNESGTKIATTTTDENGNYMFDDLFPGSYTVEVVQPDGFVNSPKYQGDTGTDSNIDAATSKSDIVTVVSGEKNQTIDAGFYKMASIGDFVWFDINANGLQDADESGIAGVKVNLLSGSGTELSTTTTNAIGFYSFTGLIPGTYTVEILSPTGFDGVSAKGQGMDTSKDSNLNDNFKSDAITLISDESNITIDAGFYKLASIGNFVWEDMNANGIQDTDEVGIAGVTVKLLDSNGDELKHTTTNSSGFYSFTGLLPATYSVELVKPDGYDNLSPKLQGSDITKDSDFNSNLKSDAITLSSEENNMTIDAGFYKLASLGDYVWNDANANGVQNTGEKGIAGVTVKLLDSTDTPIATSTTNSNGYYSFQGIVPGNYKLSFIKPTDYNLSVSKGLGGDATKDSDIDPVTLLTDEYTLVSGENNTTIDAGFFKFATIGNFVWDDLNMNGIQNVGEKGIKNISVSLLNNSGVEIATTTTDANGYYEFLNVIPDTYRIEIKQPTDYILVNKLQGSDTTIDSNMNSDLKSDAITLVSGENNMTIDAGFFKNASIGDYVWEDLNANGIQDVGEQGIANITVNLLDNTDKEIATTTTNSSGYYQFDSILPGTYQVKTIKPTAFAKITNKNQGNNTTKDSNIDNISMKSEKITLQSGEINSTIDAGFYNLSSIGDYVWEDINMNGIQDDGEHGIASVKVNLLDKNGNQIATTTTDSEGKYLFGSLVPDSYQVQIIKPTVYSKVSDKFKGSDNTKDNDIENATLKSGMITVVSGENNHTIDAGLFKLSSLGDYIWEDSNCNGLQDTNELGISAVTVNLLDVDENVIATTVTNKSGYYSFGKLVPGTYVVEVVKPTGYDNQSVKKQGSDITKDSDLNANLKSDEITLAYGENNTTVDGGFYKLASIGDSVWYDDNSNGIQNETNRGVNGITVGLYDLDDNLIKTTVTANDSSGVAGKYNFSGLIPGSYYIKFSNIPVGYSPSKINVGSDVKVDSDGDATTLKTKKITLISGQQDITWDLGIQFDSNPVKMIGSIGSKKSTDTLITDGDQVKFQYAIEFDVPENCMKVKVTDDLEKVLKVSSPSKDIKVYSDGKDVTDLFVIKYDEDTAQVVIEAKKPSQLKALRYTATIVCSIVTGADLSHYLDNTIPNTASIEINDTVEITNSVGIKPIYSSIGNYVWIDKNKDGIQNESIDYGVNGITVKLFDKNKVLIATTITMNDAYGEPGFYSFNNLNPGEYYVQFSNLPKNFIVTKKEVGDHAKDSDVSPVTLTTKVFTLNAGEDQQLWGMGIYQVKEVISTPKTGDNTNNSLLVMLAFLSSFIFVATRGNKRRSINN